jgi:hypothetical protein
MVDGVKYHTITVTKGGTPAFPADPVKEGYGFAGWFYGETSDKQFLSGDTVNANITLNARFVFIEEEGTPGLRCALIENGTAYEVSIGTATDVARIVIPSMYEGLPVIRIADWAFRWHESLSSIIIPNSATRVYSYPKKAIGIL